MKSSSVRFPAFAMVLPIAVAACGDGGVGPAPQAALSIETTNVRGPSVRGDGPSPRVRCDVTFRARASGRGSLILKGATFRFFAGVDHSTPVDVLEFSAREVQAAWDGGVLEAGTSQESEWWFELGAPFLLTGEFVYAPSPASPNATAPVRVVCGPESPGSSPAPVITDLTVALPPDGLEPADTLLVSYTASAALGLWSTAIEFTGPCRVSVESGENLRQGVTRTVPVPIPAGCPLGIPFSVTVSAVDAALRTESRRLTGPSLVDHTPPVLFARVLPVAGATTSGIQFSGDSVHVHVSAFDNLGLRALVYELLPSGLRDSIPLGSSFTGTLRIPLPTEVTGAIQLRLHLRDVTGLTSSEFITEPGALMVYPTAERPTLVSTLRTWVRDFAIDAGEGAIYVLAYNETRIRVLSTISLEVVRTIELPFIPTSVDYTPGGDSLLVIGGSGLSVIDLRQSTPTVTPIPLTLDESSGQRATRVVVLGNGKAFLALHGNRPQSSQILELDLATGVQRIRTDAANTDGTAIALSMERSPDRAAFVSNGPPGHLRRYDVPIDRFTAGNSATPYDWPFSLDRGGRHNALSLDIYDASLNFMRRVESIVSSGGIVSVATSPDGDYLYHLSPSGVLRSRVSDGLLIDRMRVPADAGLIRIASDGSFLVVAPTSGMGPLSLIPLR